MNAMIYIRGLPSDYDGWEKAGCTGWGWRNVLPDFIALPDSSNCCAERWRGPFR